MILTEGNAEFMGVSLPKRDFTMEKGRFTESQMWRCSSNLAQELGHGANAQKHGITRTRSDCGATKDAIGGMNQGFKEKIVPQSFAPPKLVVP